MNAAVLGCLVAFNRRHGSMQEEHPSRRGGEEEEEAVLRREPIGKTKRRERKKLAYGCLESPVVDD